MLDRNRLLARHFVRRFLENDLISPHTDRIQALTVIGAGLFSSGVFFTALIGAKYLFSPFQTPGRTSVLLFDDRFFYSAVSMTVMALAAVAVWDALSLDARDAAILGPLPIPRRTLVMAKLAAIAVFATALVLALNSFPAVQHTVMSGANLKLSLATAPWLMLAHAVTTISAGFFGFLTVMAIRELLRAVLGNARFRRVSGFVQAGLVLTLVVTLLLLPAVSFSVKTRWLGPDAPASTAMTIPPLWFVGLQEQIAGDVIDRLPRPWLPRWFVEPEQQATRHYRSKRPLLQALSRRAVTALGLVTVVALSLYVWNNRRLPSPLAVRQRGRSRFGRLATMTMRRVVVRHPVAQAGFFFTCQTLARSAPHRIALMASMAAGLAVVAVCLRGVDLQLASTAARGLAPASTSASGPAAGAAASARAAVGGTATHAATRDPATIPLTLLAIQTILIAALTLGVRHGMRVPAALAANWSFQLAWSGDERPYLAGVTRAVFVALGLPLLAALIPLHLLLFGAWLAAAHLLFGAILLLVCMEVATLSLRTPPFASSYVPVRNAQLLAPLWVAALMLAIAIVAAIERLALQHPRTSLACVALLAAVTVFVRTLDRQRPHESRMELRWDEPPDGVAQRFNLSG